MPTSRRAAEKEAASWYAWITKQPLQDLFYFPATNDMAVQYIVSVGEPENFGKSFTFLLTRAWLSGHVKKRKADYVNLAKNTAA